MPKGPFSSHGRQTDLRTPIGSRDAKTGLGYGVLNPKKQNPRQLGGAWPYYEKEELDPDDETIDQETADAVMSKGLSYRPSDFNRLGDPFYFVGGNTKLSDCFFRTKDVLEEIAYFDRISNSTAKNSIGPIPNLYKGAQAGLSSGPAFVYPGGGGSNFQQTGDVRGWSHAPKPIDDLDNEEQDSEEQIFNLEDLSKKILSAAGERSRSDDI